MILRRRLESQGIQVQPSSETVRRYGEEYGHTEDTEEEELQLQ